MKGNPGNWFEIYVQDMARAKKFYETVFQAKLDKLSVEKPEIWAFPMDNDHYGIAGALVKMEGVKSGGNSTLLYFRCEDCSVEAGRAVKAGGKIFKEKMAIGQYGFIVLANDTEGNLIGLHSMK